MNKHTATLESDLGLFLLFCVHMHSVMNIFSTEFNIKYLKF